MNTLHNVGKQVSSFETYTQLDAITGIALIVDEEAYIAGDDTGYMLEVHCPYGTQTMANNLLSQLGGQSYAGFRAENAPLSPAAELGDWVTVNGGTYMLAYRSVTFGPGHMSEIAAPGENVLEHEYGWSNPEKRTWERNLARSLIAKTNDMISLEIYGEDRKGGLNGRMNTFTMGLSSISNEIKGYKDTVTGYEELLAVYKQDLEGYSGEVSKYTEEVNGYKEQVISYKGSVDGFEQRVALYQEQAGKTQKAYSTIDQRVNSIKMEVTNGDNSASIQLMVDGKAQGSPAEIKMTGLVTFASLKAGGTSEIDGSRITTGKISAEHLALTGAITWNDLSSTCQSKIGDGLTENDVYTYIDKSLVASPTIAGGVFQDEAKKPDAELYLDKEYDDDDEITHAGLVLKRNIYSYKSNGDKNKLTDTLSTLQIWDSGQDLVSFLSRGNLFLRTYGGTQTYGDGAWYFGDTVYFTGNVDFSNANVIWE